MFKIRFFPLLVLPIMLWAIPFETLTIKEGSGTPIQKGQLIRVHYKGFLTDSTMFDNSYERGEPLEFSLGSGQVIPGWDKGLVGMKPGEIRRLSIPYELGYGDRAVGPIPARSDLLFEVELISADPPLDPDKFPTDLKKIKWENKANGLFSFDEKKGSGTIATQGTRVKLHYTGWLPSGRKFSSSKDLGKPLSIILGGGQLIKGWEIGLDSVTPGTVRWLKISPSMGYGAKAYSTIPPNSTLIFRTEIVNVEQDEALAETFDFFPDTNSLNLQNGKEGLRYAIIKQGEGNPATSGENVRVHYTGFLSDGTKFDSSRDRGQIFNFPLGKGSVIRGWDLGVEGMLPGEKRVLVIPPELGYGNRGGGPIPGNATLIFVVEYMGAEE
ncbi:MAG: FKBP-type peptidyl-prolyl cis-trans isomerase [Fibrobacteraceae bacterium]|nr:FKBP-type peptidyl-prolyl cis-trans isomerase [Fibrobacteraceae bacterium]